jgi:hypothetical protein
MRRRAVAIELEIRTGLCRRSRLRPRHGARLGERVQSGARVAAILDVLLRTAHGRWTAISEFHREGARL